jgi:hypothetical protein
MSPSVANDPETTKALLGAALFAAQKHRGQQRKDIHRRHLPHPARLVPGTKTRISGLGGKGRRRLPRLLPPARSALHRPPPFPPRDPPPKPGRLNRVPGFGFRPPARRNLGGGGSDFGFPARRAAPPYPLQSVTPVTIPINIDDSHFFKCNMPVNIGRNRCFLIKIFKIHSKI